MAGSVVATNTNRPVLPSPACSLKAGYAARSNAILRTALQVHTQLVRAGSPTGGALADVAQYLSLHGNWVVCAMPLARALNP